SLMVLPLLLLLAGCYEEQDVITITDDGLMRFESTVTVRDQQNKTSQEQLQQIVARVASQLEQANWKVETSWLSTERPYKVKFSGEGNLTSVVTTTPFYRLYPVGENTYTISFLTPSEGGAPSRSITFKGSTKDVGVIDRQGRPVSKVASVSDDDLYGIK